MPIFWKVMHLMYVWGLDRCKDSLASGCGDWVDAPASRQLTGTSDGTPKDSIPLGALPGQRIPWFGPGEREALGWAVWWAGPQQRWTHRHPWTADGTGRPRALQSLLGEGKADITHTHTWLFSGMPCCGMYEGVGAAYCTYTYIRPH